MMTSRRIHYTIAAVALAGLATRASAQLSTAVGAGSISFPGGRTEQATAVALRARLNSVFSLAVAPSYVWASEPSSAVLGRRATRSGLSDIPISLEAEHGFASAWHPSIGLSLTATAPVGDTASGLGSGSVGSAASLSAGLSPMSRLHLFAGAGRSLSRFSIQSTLNGSASMWGYSDVSIDLDPLSLSLGYDGDLGSYDASLGRSQSLSAGVAWNMPRFGELSLTATHGVTGPTPNWGFTLRVGVGYVGLGSAARAAFTDIADTFGGGPHGLPEEPGSNSGTGNSNGSGKGNSGSSTTGNSSFGHSRGKKGK